PRRFRCIAAPTCEVGIIQPVLINAASQDVLRVLIVNYVMLLVGNDKVLHAARYRVLPVDNLDLERSDRRMSDVNGPFDLTIVAIRNRGLAVVGARPQRAALGYP